MTTARSTRPTGTARLTPARRGGPKLTPRRASFRPRLEGLEDRAVPATVTWVNPAGGDWDTPANWSTGAVPSAADDVDINVPGVTITHNAATTHSVRSADLSLEVEVRPER